METDTDELLADEHWLRDSENRMLAFLCWKKSLAQNDVIEYSGLAERTSENSASAMMSEMKDEFLGRDLIELEFSEGRKDFYKWTSKGKIVARLITAHLYSKTHKRLTNELYYLNKVLL